MQTKNDSAFLNAGATELPRRRHKLEETLRAKSASLGVPVFMLRMFGWRKVRLASAMAVPTRRHD
jgi:hypothetical protein